MLLYKPTAFDEKQYWKKCKKFLKNVLTHLESRGKMSELHGRSDVATNKEAPWQLNSNATLKIQEEKKD